MSPSASKSKNPVSPRDRMKIRAKECPSRPPSSGRTTSKR